jgi:Flp pilus assembly secretin CpaC
MRYLSLLAAVLVSTSVCAAEFTDTLEIPPGFAQRWSAPRPFTSVIVGNPDIVDAKAETNREVMIGAKPDGGTTNVILLNDGEVVANVLVTNPATQYQLGRSAETGAWQVYRNDDKCYPVCVKIKTKPNDATPTKRIVASGTP